MKKLLNHFFFEGFTGMAWGIFATFVMGTVLQQTGNLIQGSFGPLLFQIGKIAVSLTGAGIGVGIACCLQESMFTALSAAAAGMIGAFAQEISAHAAVAENGSVILSGPGEPLGAFLAAFAAIELSRLIAGRTTMDIILCPLIGILGGSLAGLWAAPPISRLMNQLGEWVNLAAQQKPFLMGILVSVFMGMAFTLPISATALALLLNLSGLAAGAATIGCCCSTIGFAVSSYKENGIPGLLAQGLGTSMVQFPNILRKPFIWLPVILSSAILGPVGTMIAKMTNNAVGAGMGTCALIGPLMSWQTMTQTDTPQSVFIKIVLLYFILPGILTLSIANGMKKLNLIKSGDMSFKI